VTEQIRRFGLTFTGNPQFLKSASKAPQKRLNSRLDPPHAASAPTHIVLEHLTGRLLVAPHRREVQRRGARLARDGHVVALAGGGRHNVWVEVVQQLPQRLQVAEVDAVMERSQAAQGTRVDVPVGAVWGNGSGG
jgi:hypothetical protein